MSMNLYLLVGLGGFLGAVARFGLQQCLEPRTQGGFPWATLAANGLGCLCIGLLIGIARDASSLSPEARLLLVTGFLGSFTTFSALSQETLELWATGQAASAVLNVLLNLVLGLTLVALGHGLTR